MSSSTQGTYEPAIGASEVHRESPVESFNTVVCRLESVRSQATSLHKLIVSNPNEEKSSREPDLPPMPSFVNLNSVLREGPSTMHTLMENIEDQLREIRSLLT